MSSNSKALVVVGSRGSGRATAVGNLMYKCGGIDMPTLARLEKGGNSTYPKAFKEMQARKETIHFYTPKNTVTVTDDISSADGVLLVVTPEKIDEQLQEIGAVLNELRTFFAQKKAVILINKLDEHGWAAGKFTVAVQVVEEALHNLGLSDDQFWHSRLCVPASGLKGDNLIEGSANTAWYADLVGDSGVEAGNGVTVVAALDNMFGQAHVL
ncbi:hypothetical protein BDV95DRAFT_379262 [Massariosphaeria phaeospora]|uniref:P-loop containing nucleoside triphosphate hydrolase protein n=1 Tax=Massariosphaeria phaeospora TaxID=100035 RepID=A0A7C8M9J4_9PLEO|nr:hypothetical protein BDV95DRAFT_379262 [Massariosphaeria phaeospora]